MLALLVTASLGMVAAQQTQPAVSFLPLNPQAGEAVTVKVVVPAATTLAKLGNLEVSQIGSSKQVFKPVSLKDGVATYTVNLAKDGTYRMTLAGQPVQIIKVGVPKDRLQSPILHLNFDGKNPLADLSGYGNDGKVIGKVQYPTGKVGKGLSFDSEASYIEFPRSAVLETPTPNMTMSVWVKPGEQRGYADFFTKGDWNVLKTDAKNGSISFFTGGWRRGETELAQPKDWEGNWHHLVGVVEGQEARLYLDGKLVQESEVEGELKYTSFPWNLGRNAEEPKGRGFTGTMDEVRIYPFALTSAEVAQLYTITQK